MAVVVPETTHPQVLQEALVRQGKETRAARAALISLVVAVVVLVVLVETVVAMIVASPKDLAVTAAQERLPQ